MTGMVAGICPICGTTATQNQRDKGFPGQQFDCLRCGHFVLCNGMEKSIRDNWSTPQRLSVLSHKIRCRQREGSKPVEIFNFEMHSWGLDDPLPSAAEQAERLISWIGTRQTAPAQYVKIPVSEVCAWVGTAIAQKEEYFGIGLAWLLGQAEVKCLLEGSGREQREYLRLTMAGWQRYEAIMRAQVESRTAFMAMQFGDKELNSAVESCFRSAVDRAGFELRLLSDGQPAGLIDDQLRVEAKMTDPTNP
jgi:hypothetical protein